MIAVRRTPSTVVRIVGRGPLRGVARHILRKFHGGRRLHLRRMYRARRERELLHITISWWILLSVAVAFNRLGKPRALGALHLPLQVGSQGSRVQDGGTGPRFVGRGNGGQFMLGFVTGRTSGRIHAVY